MDAMPLTRIVSVTVPPGHYLLLPSVRLLNRANALFENNGRLVECLLATDQAADGILAWNVVYLDGVDAGKTPFQQLTFHTPWTFLQPTTVYLACRSNNEGLQRDRIQVFATGTALTALQAASLFAQ